MTILELAEEFRNLRKEKGISQTKLAAGTGISRTTLNQFENGKLAEFGVRKLIELLDAQGLELQIRPSGSSGDLDDLKRNQQRES